MAAPTPVPAAQLERGDFLASVAPDDICYFLINVGDADCQLLLLPAGEDGTREALVIDVGRSGKLPALINHLEALGVLNKGARSFAVVVATHPHKDHIGGMPDFLRRYGPRVKEYWDSGYRHHVGAYFDSMKELEKLQATVAYTQPTSGLLRFFGRVRVTVLAPAIQLRNRYDSYGVEPNNASVCLKVDYPVIRAVERNDERFLQTRDQEAQTVTRMILGADAQLLSWSHIMADFPELLPDESPVLKSLDMRKGYSPLRADVLKVSHHASKLGSSVELAQIVDARLALVSSLGAGSRHGFPHTLTQDAFREARIPMAKSGGSWVQPDHEMGLHYTGGLDNAGRELGTICLVIKPTGRRVHLWRFLDSPDDPIDLGAAHRYRP